MWRHLIVFAAVVAMTMAHKDTERWVSYKKAFDLSFENDEEDARKMATFLQAVHEIEEHNYEADLGKHTFWQGVNQFTHMTDKEFKDEVLGNCYNASEPSKADAVFKYDPNGPILGTVDWRQQGMVTGVKNQGGCGSCYSFSATGALEGQWKKKTGNLISMSEQQIVDCSSRYGNHGCHGGRFQSAWNYIRDAGGINSERDYPYQPRQGYCRKRSTVVAKVSGVHQIPHNNENALKQALAQVGPISVAIDASPSSFRRYRSGVHYSPYCHHPNHAVLAVGYGTENGQDYYLVKNSWGTRYGQGGYVKMARNRNNNCCIACDTAYPTV